MMAIRVGLVALVLLAGAGGLLRRAAPAQACSADEQWDPVAQSEVIVGGRIEGYTPLPDRSRSGMFIPVRLEMRIDHVWKGTVSPGAEIVDRASFMLQPVFTDKQEVRIAWAGSGGACGALNEDPSGQYAVFGLFAAPDGSLQTTSLRTFYLSPRAYDPANVRLVSQRIGLPVAGMGPHGRSTGAVGEAMLFAGAALCGLGLALRTRSWMHPAGGQI
jgi:hypothetical protein